MATTILQPSSAFVPQLPLLCLAERLCHFCRTSPLLLHPPIFARVPDKAVANQKPNFSWVFEQHAGIMQKAIGG
jgi:hypothetical protein